MIKHKGPMVGIGIILVLILMSKGIVSDPAESLNLPTGISADYNNHNKKYIAAISVYTFNKKDELKGYIIASQYCKDLIECRQSRQLSNNQKFIFGLQRVLLIGKNLAKKGILNLVDIIFSNINMNDMGYVVLCEGNAMDILKQKISDYPTASDYINGMIKFSTSDNFFGDNYKVIDIFVRLDAEGRNIVLPVISGKNHKLLIIGFGLFKKDKLVKIININEAHAMNIIREDNSIGRICIDKPKNKILDFEVTASRKIKCTKKKGKYTFLININLTGQILNNTVYKNLISDSELVDKAKKDLEKTVKKMCTGFIKKMQHNYKLDCLELGRVGAATYGRNKGTDWDNVVSNSKIIVNVKANIDSFGRGEFYTQRK